MKTFKERINEIKNPTHQQVFNVVKDMVNEDISLDDTNLFDRNILTELFDAYYNEYQLAVYDEDGETLISVRESEALLPLNERSSGICEELKWIMDGGYDINAHTSVYCSDDDDDWFDYSVIPLFAFPRDVYMAEWFIENGGEKQLHIDIGDGETLGRWCFDNLDIISEDYIYAEFDVTVLCKVTADIVRLMIKSGIPCKGGFWMSVDENNMVSYSRPWTY